MVRIPELCTPYCTLLTEHECRVRYVVRNCSQRRAPFRWRRAPERRAPFTPALRGGGPTASACPPPPRRTNGRRRRGSRIRAVDRRASAGAAAEGLRLRLAGRRRRRRRPPTPRGGCGGLCALSPLPSLGGSTCARFPEIESAHFSIACTFVPSSLLKPHSTKQSTDSSVVPTKQSQSTDCSVVPTA